MVPGIARTARPRAFRSRRLHRRRRHRPQLRVAHLSPDTPGVDVYVDGAQAVGNMGFETVTDYLPVPAGEPRARAAAERRGPELGAGVVGRGHPREREVLHRRRPRSAARSSRRISSRTTSPLLRRVTRTCGSSMRPSGPRPSTSPSAGSSLTFTDASFATPTDYQAVAAGKYDVTLTDGSGNDLVGSQSIEFSPGINYTVAAIGGGGTPLRLLPVVDARGVVVSPVGALSTGAGGTAPRPHPGPGLLRHPFIVGGVLITAGIAIAAQRRRLASTPREERPPRRDAGRSAPRREHGLGLRRATRAVPRRHLHRAPTTTLDDHLTAPERTRGRSRRTQPAYTPTPVRLQEPASRASSTSPRSVSPPTSSRSASARTGRWKCRSDFDQAGWYIAGPKPGETGPAVIAGHVDDTSGPAVFYRLKDLTAGADIVVTRVDGTSVTFRVAARRVVREAGVPDRRGVRTDARGRAETRHLRRRLRLEEAQLQGERRRLRRSRAVLTCIPRFGRPSTKLSPRARSSVVRAGDS